MDLVGSFGEVFKGIWRGTEVAIKVMLEQDLTVENTQDFCNEISLLRYTTSSHPFIRFMCVLYLFQSIPFSQIHLSLITRTAIFWTEQLLCVSDLQPITASEWYESF